MYKKVQLSYVLKDPHYMLPSSPESNIAIRVRGLSKKYTLGGSQEKYLTFRHAIVNSVKAPFKRFNRTPLSEEFWVQKK
jgi:hypothetical protein